MKLIAKNVTREVVAQFEAQLFYTGCAATGNTKTYTCHYYVGPGECGDEVARITYNFETKLYNLRLAD